MMSENNGPPRHDGNGTEPAPEQIFSAFRARIPGATNAVMSAAEHHSSFGEAIIDTIREPLLVLDEGLHVLAASQSFYRAFKVSPRETEARAFFELGNGEWNIPALRRRLDDIIAKGRSIEAFEVELDFPGVGHRTMLLNARKILNKRKGATSVLVAIEDVTERRALEHEKDELLGQKELLLQEMNHRVNNSLHIIASILMLKAQTVQSEETRRHLCDAHTRVMAVATVQGQLHPSVFGSEIAANPYLTKLCESLAASMILDGQPITLQVAAGEGAMSSEQAVSMGLIATELVINALKHAFPDGRGGKITVEFVSTARAWRLTVSDDGVGISKSLSGVPARIGLGTSIIDALARQLGGQVLTQAQAPGTSVSVTVPRAD
jgi:two-component sensor histidine kinase